MLHEKRWIGMKIPYCTREFEMDKSHLVAPPGKQVLHPKMFLEPKLTGALYKKK
jgi:hypothetical protein